MKIRLNFEKTNLIRLIVAMIFAAVLYFKVTFPVYNVPDPVYNTMNGLVEIMNDKELKKLTFSLKDYVGNLI